jgi:hypothetical protein
MAELPEDLLDFIKRVNRYNMAEAAKKAVEYFEAGVPLRTAVLVAYLSDGIHVVSLSDLKIFQGKKFTGKCSRYGCKNALGGSLYLCGQDAFCSLKCLNGENVEESMEQ